MKQILFLCLALAMVQCAPKQPKAIAATKLSEEATWAAMQQFIGEWYDESQNVYELWESNGNYSLKGEGYQKDLAGNHQTSESLKLMWAPGVAMTYEATVMRDNMGTTTRFRMTQATKTVFTFENPAHDFPKMIKYTITSPTTMDATISAGAKAMTFHFKRVVEPKEGE
jgi:hypothetical protein